MERNLINRELEEDEITIDLSELCLAIWRKMPLVILLGIIFAVLAFLGTKVEIKTSRGSGYLLEK